MSFSRAIAAISLSVAEVISLGQRFGNSENALAPIRRHSSIVHLNDSMPAGVPSGGMRLNGWKPTRKSYVFPTGVPPFAQILSYL